MSTDQEQNMRDKIRGLYNKFRVERVDGSSEPMQREGNPMNYSNLPQLGAPLDGGTFIGLTTSKDGKHYAVTLLAASIGRAMP